MFVQFFRNSRSLKASAQIGLGVAGAVLTIHKSGSGSGSREGSGSDSFASRGSGIAGLEVKVSVLEEVEGSGRWRKKLL